MGEHTSVKMRVFVGEDLEDCDEGKLLNYLVDKFGREPFEIENEGFWAPQGN